MRKMLSTVLMVPVAGAAAFVGVEVGKAWNEAAGYGGAAVVGLIAAVLHWSITEPDGDHRDKNERSDDM